jgi:hypothetical protein
MFVDRAATSLTTPFGRAEINETLWRSKALRSSERSSGGPGWRYKHLTPNGVKPRSSGVADERIAQDLHFSDRLLQSPGHRTEVPCS